MKGRYACPICGTRQTGNADVFYADMRKWIGSILATANGKTYENTVKSVRLEVLFPDECFCGKRIDDGWVSSFRTILKDRLDALLQQTGSKTSTQARKDCRKAILGDQGADKQC